MFVLMGTRLDFVKSVVLDYKTTLPFLKRLCSRASQESPRFNLTKCISKNKIAALGRPAHGARAQPIDPIATADLTVGDVGEPRMHA
jgi:hypothetical protein